MTSERRHARKADRGYLSWLHGLPCACAASGGCWGPITAHHAGVRGLGQKAPDRTAIPLCAFHHQEGPDAAHRLGKAFWEHHGIDRDQLITSLNERYDRLKT